MNGSYAVAVHFNSADTTDWSMALSNVSNLYRNESLPTGQGDLSFVVNGHGVRFLDSDGRESEQVRRMAEAGVRVVACGNSLSRFDIDEADVVDAVEVTASGVAELARLQPADHAYLKVP